MSCGPPLTLLKRTTLPALTVSAAGSKAALLVPSPVIFTSTTAVGLAVAAAGAVAALAVATPAVCEAAAFFSPRRAAPRDEVPVGPALGPRRLDRAQPVAGITGLGISGRKASQYLRDKGFEAFAVTGGMAAGETVLRPRALSPPPTLQHVIQLDRVG